MPRCPPHPCPHPPASGPPLRLRRRTRSYFLPSASMLIQSHFRLATVAAAQQPVDLEALFATWKTEMDPEEERRATTWPTASGTVRGPAGAQRASPVPRDRADATRVPRVRRQARARTAARPRPREAGKWFTKKELASDDPLRNPEFVKKVRGGTRPPPRLLPPPPPPSLFTVIPQFMRITPAHRT